MKLTLKLCVRLDFLPGIPEWWSGRNTDKSKPERDTNTQRGRSEEIHTFADLESGPTNGLSKVEASGGITNSQGS
jgi:hypothetical protein